MLVEILDLRRKTLISKGMCDEIDFEDQDKILSSSRNQDLDWRERLALHHVKSLLTRDVMDVIKANTDDLGPLSLDSFRKTNLFASWKFVGREIPAENKAMPLESNQRGASTNQETSRSKVDASSKEDRSQFVDTPAKAARRQ